ncbi:hypothetical protein NL676_014980 [Syzygium grande]|nr:hypothetical protein NL676_014980 [Syzygium grande]
MSALYLVIVKPTRPPHHHNGCSQCICDIWRRDYAESEGILPPTLKKDWLQGTFSHFLVRARALLPHFDWTSFLGIEPLWVVIIYFGPVGFSRVLSGVLFAASFAKYMEWSAIWNMGIVISILEEKHGDIAL